MKSTSSASVNLESVCLHHYLVKVDTLAPNIISSDAVMSYEFNTCFYLSSENGMFFRRTWTIPLNFLKTSYASNKLAEIPLYVPRDYNLMFGSLQKALLD